MKMRVEYIKRPYKDKVYRYPFLVSSYRDENGKPQRKVHQSLSHLPEVAVKALNEALRHGTQPDYVDIKDIIFEEGIDFGDAWGAYRVSEDLGIPKHLDLLPVDQRTPIMAMIIDRVVNPKPHSKRALADDYDGSALSRILGAPKGPPLGKWYKSLESLYSHQTKIQKNLFKGSSDRVFLYDITSSYFEGKCCPLAAFGYNRDGKKGKLQIVVGLLCNGDGRPIAVRVFEGNTKDDTTVLSQVRQLKEEFGVSEMIFVGDRGMITSKRIKELESEDYSCLKYITALKRSEMMSLVEDENHPIQLGLFDHKNLAEVVEGDKRYILCHNPLRKEDDARTRERLLQMTEQKLQSIANNVRAGRLKCRDKIARRLYRWINKWNMERFFNVSYDEGKFEFSRKEDEIKRYSVLDGCYIIVTDLPAESMGKDEVRDRYKSLGLVEKAFRTMKTTELEMRPIRHWNPISVKGHIFVCMLSYLVIWEARNRLAPLLERDPETRECEGKSLKEIWGSLRKIKLGKINCGGRVVYDVSIFSDHQKRILGELDAKLNVAARDRLGLCRQKNQSR